MKKTIAVILASLLLVSLTAFALADANVTAPPTGSRMLVVYFSVMETDGVDTVSGASRVVKDDELMGNNQYIARLIARETGADVFSIETTQAYPETHAPLLEFGHSEQASGVRPELATHIEHIDDYDTIFLGFPIWNADFPMPLYSFLEEYDFTGKTVIPFTVHGGSGFAGTIRTLAELQPGATVVQNGLSISRNDVSESEADVLRWLDELALTEE